VLSLGNQKTLLLQSAEAAIDAATEPDEKSVTKDRELSLLYVGCTRARDQTSHHLVWSALKILRVAIAAWLVFPHGAAKQVLDVALARGWRQHVTRQPTLSF
jgi:hypothetical protein